jgi:hypothetical protein
MLKIVSFPYGPLSWIAVMLLVLGISMISQSLVSILLFTQITDRICASFCSLCVGYTGLKFAGVLIALNVVVYGSCISIMSYLLLTLSLMMSRCARLDLLRLIWMIRILLFISV